MSTILNAHEREDLRLSALAFLAACNTNAFTAGQLAAILRRRKAVEFVFTDADVESALVFLDGQKWATPLESQFGASKPRQATSAGVLEAERLGLC